MPATISEIGPCKKLLQVNVPKDFVRERLDRNYKDLVNSIALPGFRKGKVPRAVLEKRFGKHVEQELTQTLVQETLGEALEENKLQPIGEPKLDKVEFDASKDPALVYQATVSVRPEFDLPSLEGIKVEKKAVEVSDAEVDESLEQSRRARGELRPKADDATVGAEDFMIADISVSAEGTETQSREGGHYWVKNGLLDFGIEVTDLGAKLASTKIGESVTFVHELPQRYPAAAARGKPGTVTITVKELKELKLPPLDDAFAKDAGFETLKELKDEVRQRLLRQKDQDADLDAEERAVEMALDRVDFAVPADVVDQELDELALRAQMSARYRGMSEQEAAAEAGKVRSGSRADVERRLKGVFLLDKIAKEQKIFATEDEVRQAVSQMAAQHNRSEAELEAEMEKQGGIVRLRFDIRLDKARKWLRSKVEVVETTTR
jgi:trigger factor